MKKLGYREMLRDRCPKIVNYALKWCKAKDKWIEHVYKNFIGIYVDKDQRNRVTRIMLGIGDNNKYNFDFDKTVDWDNLTPKEKEYWEHVSSWVKWFMKTFQYIEEMYDTSTKKGDDYFDIQIKIIQTYLSWLLPSPSCTPEEKEAKYQYVDNLAEFLMKCIEGNIKLTMISIFSNYLVPIWGSQVQELKPSEIYDRLRIAYNQGSKGIVDNVRMFSVGNDDDDYDIICESFRPALKRWINWVNSKITLQLGKCDYRTIDVRLRIAINMLDKIDLPIKTKFNIRLNLITNLRWEMSAINTEDLPFLGSPLRLLLIATAHLHSTVCYRSDTLITGFTLWSRLRENYLFVFDYEESLNHPRRNWDNQKGASR